MNQQANEPQRAGRVRLDAARALAAPRSPGMSISSPSTAQLCCSPVKKPRNTSGAKAIRWSFWVDRQRGKRLVTQR